MNTRATPFRHGEAFKLMWYACRCGHRERIWNSRDGVTPFCTACPSCGAVTLAHTDWQSDEFAPDHKPHRGQQFFRDGTADEAVAIIEKRLRLFRDAGQPAPAEVADALRREAREQTGDWRKGWPALDRETH